MPTRNIYHCMLKDYFGHAIEPLQQSRTPEKENKTAYTTFSNKINIHTTFSKSIWLLTPLQQTHTSYEKDYSQNILETTNKLL